MITEYFQVMGWGALCVSALLAADVFWTLLERAVPLARRIRRWVTGE